jgi:excisionase family DNA binding protein
MAGRKIFCGVVEGIVYDDRCLFKLSKVIEDNKTCEGCILREIEKVKLEKTKRFDTKDIRETKDIRDIKDTRRRRRRKGSPRGKPNLIGNEDTIQTYSSQDLIDLLGKSERDIQRLAQEGKIPAHKVGRKWRFPKEEFDRWLSEKEHHTDIVPTEDGHSNDVVMTTNTAFQGEDVRPLDESVEGIAGESLNKEDSESISN